jgi:hypothetical protein
MNSRLHWADVRQYCKRFWRLVDRLGDRDFDLSVHAHFQQAHGGAPVLEGAHVHIRVQGDALHRPRIWWMAESTIAEGFMRALFVAQVRLGLDP